ncbi:SDR family oxidoreductase [Parasediminibacterium paludis]|uniref:dTDP-4-dehydrorhamnose reductase n=1 Tax=Parasediminibacterium paludis TaxID=908966 RepID=A0ABV8PV52_9BACT
MKILITGSNGFLGQHLCLSLANKGFEVIATSRGICKIEPLGQIKYQAVDVTKKTEIENALAFYQPDVIIHNAAMSKPDDCLNNQDDCILQNVTATENLVEAAKSLNSYVIYVSTDFVFGDNGPHHETASKCPLNFYGKSKLMAEEIVRQSGLKSVIMRPVFIYGKQLPNMKGTFLHWVKNSLSNGQKIKVVNDQHRTPTYVNDICDGLIVMIEKQVIGDFHLAGIDLLTPYQMAIILANTLQLDASLITPVTSETFTEPVQRAKHGGLKIDKAIRELDYQPVSFEEGVRLSFL